MASAQAFRDTSPFLIFSSSPLPKSLQALAHNQLQPVDNLLKETKAYLQSCPSDIYYIFTQPSLSSTDVHADTYPILSRRLSSPSTSSLLVSDVKGLSQGHAQALMDEIVSACKGHSIQDGPLKGGKKVVKLVQFEDLLPLTRGERDERLRNNDERINKQLHAFSKKTGYIAIYTSTPLNSTVRKDREPTSYESEFQEAVHMDLRRDLESRVPPKTNQTDQRPLFEKYQFLTPGLFMGLLVGAVLLSILGVGLNAISSLQVSYAAFDKEMGPAAQKKLQ